MEWRKVESTVMPLEIDTVSSKTVVYQRQNIEEKTKVDEQTQEEITYYEYDERIMSRVEYQAYLVSLEMAEKINAHSDQEAIDRYTEELMEGGIL